jgi:hypothetical protein
MGRFSTVVLGISGAVLLAGCQTSAVSPYAVTGVQHTEPVEFNNQRYQVTFEYKNALAGYDIQVDRPARPLSDGAGDRQNAISVATSSVTHFACANGQRAHIVDGSASFTGSSTWAMQAKCS